MPKNKKANKMINPMMNMLTKMGRGSRGYATNGTPIPAINSHIVSGSSSVPDHVTVCLRYAQVVALSTASTGYAENIFRINSVFDPDYSGAGSQPVGFDQWAAFYSQYRVERLDWVMKAGNPTSLAESVFSATPNLVNTIDASGANIWSEPRSVNTILSSNGGWADTLSGTIFPHEIFGVSRSTYTGEESYSAPTSTNPTNVAYMHARLDTMSGGLSGTGYVLVDFLYTVYFYKRVELELSLLSLSKALVVPPTSTTEDKGEKKKIVLSQKALKQLGVEIKQ